MKSYELAVVLKSLSLVLSVAAATYLGHTYLENENHETNMPAVMMLMQSGMSGVLARCFVESKDPRDVKTCHQESLPADRQQPKTKGLPL